MNFFGHAVVAGWKSDQPAFGFGAMLPDLVTISRTRLPPISSASLSRGVDWHHETDRVFHEASVFLSLCRTASAELRKRGLGRGPALGAAHVCTELLLDGYLMADDNGCQAYRAALDWGVYHFQEAPEALQSLLARMKSEGLPTAYRDPERVAARTARALSGRPRLRMQPAEVTLVETWLPGFQSEVLRQAPSLTSHLRATLLGG